MYKVVAKVFDVDCESWEIFEREFRFVDIRNAEKFLEMCSECLDFSSGYVVSELTGEVLAEK